jgi:hypothetical protein
MTRFLQAVFPNSYFIVVRRHPIPVSMGTPKLGQATATSLHRLFAHWLHCHELFEADKRYLKRVYELTYEDYIANPDKYHQEIAAFVNTRAPAQPMTEVKPDRSKKYFDKWQRLLTTPFFKGYYRHVAATFEPRFAKYGYSLIDCPKLKDEIFAHESKIANALGSFGCLGADAYALALRVRRWPPPKTRRRIKAMLPQALATKITEIRRRGFIGKKRARQPNRVAASTGGRPETSKSV